MDESILFEDVDVEALRAGLQQLNGGYFGHEVAELVDPLIAALNRIQAENEKLREALTFIANSKGEQPPWDMSEARTLALATLKGETDG